MLKMFFHMLTVFTFENRKIAQDLRKLTLDLRKIDLKRGSMATG